MTYHNVARHLAAEGRGADSTLVHMSPREVKSLQDLAMAHGGSLTVNPSTGLPEAGFLERLLPAVVGAGLSMIPGVGPLMAAGIVGGGTALATGNLGKGIAAGLGAYGGAGLAGGLMGAGAGTAEAAANALGVEGAATGVGSQAAMLAAQNQGFGQAGLEALGQSAGYASGASPVIASPFQSVSEGLQGLTKESGRNAFMQGVGGLGGLAKTGLAAMVPAMMAPTTPQPSLPTSKPLNRLEYQSRPISPTPSSDVPGYGDLGRDFGRQQRYFDSRFVDTGRPFVPGDFGPAGMAKGGSVPGYFFGGFLSNMRGQRDYENYLAQTQDERAVQQQAERLRRIAPSYEEMSEGKDFGYQIAKESPSFNPTPAVSSSEAAPIASAPSALSSYVYESTPLATSGAGYVPEYGDQGGDFGQQQQYFSRRFRAITPPPAPAPAPTPTPYYDPGYSTWAAGGETHLGDYSDGGRMLRGPGDGVSDSIPATIGGKQPARLADGEFVVPARIVSELGNGSSEAGARKLYAMMDRIQSARGKTVGKKRVAVDSKAEKLLPA